MNETKLGQEAAFPKTSDVAPQKGMSKRFYTACMMMSAIIASPKSFYVSETETTSSNTENKVTMAYSFADELLKQENL